jgi:phage-related protein
MTRDASTQIELTKVLRGREHRTFTAVFRCKPYRYVVSRFGGVYQNRIGTDRYESGNVEAEPLIVVTGSGDISLTIGAKTMQIAGLASKITIDVAAG